MKKMNRKNLILLAIIIILVTLSCVSINLIVGEKWNIKKEKIAKQNESEETVREKLELILSEAQTEKKENPSYNSEDYLTEFLEKNNITVEKDNIIVDNYNFIIDRDNLVILESLGETSIKITTEITQYLGKNENDKYEINMLLVVESKETLQNVVIQMLDSHGNISEMEIETENMKLGKDIQAELDEKYVLTITTQKENTEIRTIFEKSEEKIKNTDELIKFRDNVNSGLTYEGKTIEVISDLDLSNVCGANIESWNPIGTLAKTFKGNFNGNNHKISNLFINKKSSYQGLFGVTTGLIENIVLENVQITTSENSYYIGALVGKTTGEVRNIRTTSGTVKGGKSVGAIVGESSNKIEKCINNIEVTAYLRYVGGIVGYSSSTITKCGNYAKVSTENHAAGGIAGHGKDIDNCFNKGNITTTLAGTGGIAGAMWISGIIQNCYNTGSITGYRQTAGIVGDSYTYNNSPTKTIRNCYNIGTITASSRAGSITGISQYTQINNCIWTTSQKGIATDHGGSTSVNSEKVTEEVLKSSAERLSSDYFINDILDETTGEYIYNKGFPILKWQIEE